MYKDGWINEDELPSSVTDEEYKVLFPFSRVFDGVRMFPRSVVYERIEINETKEYANWLLSQRKGK